MSDGRALAGCLQLCDLRKRHVVAWHDLPAAGVEALQLSELVQAEGLLNVL